MVCRVWAAVGGKELGLLLTGCCEGDQRRRRSIEMGGAPLVSMKAEWVSACGGRGWVEGRRGYGGSGEDGLPSLSG